MTYRWPYDPAQALWTPTFTSGAVPLGRTAIRPCGPARRSSSGARLLVACPRAPHRRPLRSRRELVDADLNVGRRSRLQIGSHRGVDGRYDHRVRGGGPAADHGGLYRVQDRPAAPVWYPDATGTARRRLRHGHLMRRSSGLRRAAGHGDDSSRRPIRRRRGLESDRRRLDLVVDEGFPLPDSPLLAVGRSGTMLISPGQRGGDRFDVVRGSLSSLC